MKISDSIELLNKEALFHNSQAEALKELIAVKEPYFALTNLQLKDDELSATMPFELSDHMELYGMGIPEIGRHMAILGSLALANSNPKKEKHYYLATHAIVERTHSQASGDGEYSGKVRTVSFTKRVGKIKGEIYSGGILQCTIEVSYAVLHDLTFNRMFAKDKQTTNFIPTYNPYEKSSRLYNINLGCKNADASLGTIKQEDCAGHFHDFAALPIARLGGALTNLSGLLFNHLRYSDERYSIHKAEISAKSFVFSGKKLELYAQVEHNEENEEVIIKSHASTNDCQHVVEYKLSFFKT